MNNGITKVFDLEERTYIFAKRTRDLIRKLPKTINNIDDSSQLNRSSGSVPANYIEANESLGKKDFIMHIKICRKEAKESILWLRLIFAGNNVELETERQLLIQEARELMKIFGSMVRKNEN